MCDKAQNEFMHVWHNKVSMTHTCPSVYSIFFCALRVEVGLLGYFTPYTVRTRYNGVTFLTNIHKKTPHSSLARAMYGVSFVGPASDRYSGSVPVIFM